MRYPQWTDTAFACAGLLVGIAMLVLRMAF